ncbi:MAG: ROK family protein [Lentisphaeria bacterium]|nr:ROK family protein [Lentisphaeria bacterium]
MLANHIIVLDAVRAKKNQAFKKDLCQQTGLSWGTLCKTVDSLLAGGFLNSRKERTSRPGRPIVPLGIEGSAACFAGMDVGAEHTRVLFADLNLEPLYQQEVPTPRYSDPEPFYAWLTGVYTAALAASGVARERVRTLGLAVSGNVDSEHGVIVSGGNFGMSFGANLPVSALASRLGVPVFAMSTQVAAVWAEYQFGTCAGYGNLVNIGLGVGIGSGIVANHVLLYSHPKRPVGYIGHILIPGNDHVCSCGFKGCLEAYSGGDYLVGIARERFPQRPELHGAAELDRAAGAGDADARAVLDTAAAYNAVGVAAMIQLYAPDALIFSGRQSRADGYVYQRTIAELKGILPRERRNCFIGITSLGAYQSALGAMRLGYEHWELT